MTEKNWFNVDFDIADIEKDRSELRRYITTFTTLEHYKKISLEYAESMKKNYESIDKKYLEKITYDFQSKMKKILESIDHNQKFLDQVVSKYKPSDAFYKLFKEEEINYFGDREVNFLTDSAFFSIVRDWTKERTEERNNHYIPIVEEVKANFPDKTKKYNILVPGSGFSRLVFDLAKEGFNIECNDYSYLYVILSEFIFNCCKKEEFSIAPLIFRANDYSTEDAFCQKYSFPDVDLIRPEGAGDINMTPGDFNVVYKNQKEKYDCVVTCYFIDTGTNVLQYLDTIYNSLKKGGIWINLGPLGYHWSGMDAYVSIELPYDKLKETIINFGFEYLKESQKAGCYCEANNYMMNDIFHSFFFTCRKK